MALPIAGNVKDRHPWCQTVAPAPSPRAGREFARHGRLGADCGLARRIPAFLTQTLMLLVAVVAALILVLLLRRRRGGGRQRALAQLQSGRASCRERVGQYG